VTVRHGDKVFQQVEASHVLFNELTSQQIHHYLANTDWGDKAGGYAIQMSGGLIVRKIDGCYYNVMGLPINTAETLLKRVGIDLWNHPWR
jgi:septum formation protein